MYWRSWSNRIVQLFLIIYQIHAVNKTQTWYKNKTSIIIMFDIIFFLNNDESCNSIIYIFTAFVIGTTYNDLYRFKCYGMWSLVVWYYLPNYNVSLPKNHDIHSHHHHNAEYYIGKIFSSIRLQFMSSSKWVWNLSPKTTVKIEWDDHQTLFILTLISVT